MICRWKWPVFLAAVLTFVALSCGSAALLSAAVLVVLCLLFGYISVKQAARRLMVRITVDQNRVQRG